MPQPYQLTIADQRAATPDLMWLTLHAPELARSVRAGNYLLVRCTEDGSYDPLLRRALFVAAAEAALGQVALLYQPAERGLAWLARGRPGDQIDIIGPFGQPFTLDRQTRSLLLIGAGPGLAALLLLAQQANARGCAVTLLAGASHPEALPPAFLLPADVEYHTVLQIADFRLQTGQGALQSPINNLQSAISWADQLCAALPGGQLAPLAAAVQAARLRWERGFASVLVEAPLICGTGACGACALETRRGVRLPCSDGPVFDLRDLNRK